MREEYAKVVGPKLRLRWLLKRDLIDLTMENVVVNLAGRFKVFHDMESVLQWLGVEE